MSKNPLKSRKFWIALGTAVIDIGIVFVPELEPVRKELIVVITALAAVWMATIAGEDMAYWHGKDR